jgi:hypothetical protein
MLNDRLNKQFTEELSERRIRLWSDLELFDNYHLNSWVGNFILFGVFFTALFFLVASPIYVGILQGDWWRLVLLPIAFFSYLMNDVYRPKAFWVASWVLVCTLWINQWWIALPLQWFFSLYLLRMFFNTSTEMIHNPGISNRPEYAMNIALILFFRDKIQFVAHEQKADAFTYEILQKVYKARETFDDIGFIDDEPIIIKKTMKTPKKTKKTTYSRGRWERDA